MLVKLSCKKSFIVGLTIIWMLFVMSCVQKVHYLSNSSDVLRLPEKFHSSEQDAYNCDTGDDVSFNACVIWLSRVHCMRHSCSCPVIVWLPATVDRKAVTAQHIYTQTAQVVDQHQERRFAAAVGLPQLRHLGHPTSSLQRSASSVASVTFCWRRGFFFVRTVFYTQCTILLC